jgi:hypothetical protein
MNEEERCGEISLSLEKTKLVWMVHCLLVDIYSAGCISDVNPTFCQFFQNVFYLYRYVCVYRLPVKHHDTPEHINLGILH